MIIHDKDSVVSLLERLERVCREVKGLPEFVKRSMALNAGLLENDLDDLEGLIEQTKEHVETMRDADDSVDLDIKDNGHRSSIRYALRFIDSLEDDDQVEIFDVVVKEITAFDSDIERLNACLVDAKKPWRVIDSTQYENLKELVDSL